jgi:uncharacterized membrane-anchored protein
MRKKLTHVMAALMAMVLAAPAFADGNGSAGPDVAAPPVNAAPTQPSAEPVADGRSGIIPLDDSGISLNVPDGYRFYAAPEAQAFLQRSGAAAPNGAVFGLLARAGDDIRQPGTWATVISYDAIGYVQPETAAGLSATSFEDDVRGARRTQGRVFEGFAEAPGFNADTPHLVWAERAAGPGSQGKDLRYEQKVLGRYGVAGLTSIGSADQMPEITAAAEALRGMLSFNPGARHADFLPASDQVSSYSVPGLVTGVPSATPQALAESATAPAGQTAFGGLPSYFPWVALGVIVLAIAGYMMLRRREQHEAA